MTGDEHTDGGGGEAKTTGERERSGGGSRFSRRAYLQGVLATGAVAGLGGSLVTAQTDGEGDSEGTVLILDTTVTGGESSLEAEKAQELGFDVEVVTAEEWGEMTTEEFESYRAIVLGDPNCAVGTGPLAPAEENVETWSDAVTGNVVVVGTDPAFHRAQGGDETTEGGINFATAEADNTGAYITTSCYYDGAEAETPVPVLDGFGTFTATSVPGCFDNIAVVAESPDLTGYTEENLGPWGCSVHNAFDNWPLDFEVVGLALEGDDYTAPDGTVGTPYILARGVAVISDISLAPESAEVPVGESHTLTATVEFDEEPLADSEVTFTVIDGPNEGTSGTAETNDAGEATFSYEGTDTGTDTVEAEFTDPDGVTQRSNRVTVTWTSEAPDTEAAVTFSDQDSDGESVVVSEVVVPEGGFVTIHDETLLDGDAIGSVRGTSAYLSAGTHTDVEVTLDRPISESQTLIAMPHMDTNDNETYEFVTSEGEDDGPYTVDGEAVTDDACIEVEC